MAVQRDLSRVQDILIVDDIVTRGATLLGAANRLCESYPDVPIRAFAAMRTVSNPSIFRALNEPLVWTITLQPDGSTLRRPETPY
jgi:adenine/guanine phosphoribosyltransferase-like PRPP-binding protein